MSTHQEQTDLNSQGYRPNRFYAGVFIGTSLLGVSILFYMLKLQIICELTLCVGFGILLGAFGTRAKAQWQSITVVGAGATSVMLFLLVQQYKDCQSVTEFYLHGNFTDAIEVNIRDNGDLLGALSDENRVFHFIVKGDEIARSFLELNISYPNEERNQIIEISAKHINPVLRQGKVIWDYRIGGTVTDKSGDTISIESGTTHDVQQSSLNFFSTAFAGTVLSDSLVKKLLVDLESPHTSIRRKARVRLAEAGTEVLPALQAVLHEKFSVYRVRLGVVYIISHIVNTHKLELPTIRKILDEKSMTLLEQATSDESKTISRYAIGALQQLKDISATTKKDRYYVIISSHQDKTLACQSAEAIQKQHPNQSLQLRLSMNQYYAVILGDVVDRQQGLWQVKQAKNRGIILDAYINPAFDWGQNIFPCKD